MKRTAVILATLLIATSAFSHAGHAHVYMGTVTALHGDGRFTVKTTEGKEVTIRTTSKTAFTPQRSALTVGGRVVVRMLTDGKTAASVRMSAAAAPVASVPALIDALRAAGFKVRSAGTLDQPFFSVPAQVFVVGEDDLQVYTFQSAADAENAAKKVSPTGGTIGTTAMHWMAPPHFFRRGRLIALHLGHSQKVLAEMKRLLGEPFAGHD